jgi:nitrilase
MIKYPAFKIAAMHVAPVFLDSEATTNKACSLIEEAFRSGAQLVAFPETYIPAYPVWSGLRSPVYNHDMFRRLAANAIMVPGPEVARLCETARRCGVFVSIGINEGTPASVGCIWNSNLLIGDDGSIINHHRKLVPTHYEKLTWANGDGAGLRVVETRLGRVGMLICGENTNPLARFTQMAQGEQVHVSTWPPIYPYKDPKEGENYPLNESIYIRVRSYSFEAKNFNIAVASFMDKPMRDELVKLHVDADRLLEASTRGVSMVTGPNGEILGQPMSHEEGILYVDIDLADCVEPKQVHDIIGYYNRFDVFKLTVNRSANRPISFEADVVEREGHAKRTSEPSQRGAAVFSDLSALRLE